VNKFDTRKFLELLNVKVPAAQQRSGWTIASCPLAPWKHDGGTDKKPAFACKDEPGDARMNCFACAWHGSMSDLLEEMHYLNTKEMHVDPPWAQLRAMVDASEAAVSLSFDHPTMEELLVSPKGVHVFPTWWLESFPPVWDMKPAMHYLVSRGVDLKTIAFLDLRYDSQQKRICFPVRDFNGDLVGLHGRAIMEDTEPRYRMYTQAKQNNPICWLGESWVDLNRPILVVEGPFDVASCLRVYPNTVSPLFASPGHAKVRRMADALEWVTLLDAGKGGDAGRKKIGHAIGQTHLLTHAKLPKGVKDPGVATEEELRGVLADLLPLVKKGA
jgi:hypothetical protein